jgi:hypothetical protein
MRLEQQEWKTLPWALEPDSKSEQAKLFDIFVMVPGLLEDYERMLSWQATCTSGSNDRTSEIVVRQQDSHYVFSFNLRDRIVEQLQLLFRWRQNWQQRHGGGVMLLHKSRGIDKGPAEFNGSLLEFAAPVNAMIRAAEMTLYNAILLWLLVLLWNTRHHVAQVTDDISRCVPLERESSKSTCAEASADSMREFAPLAAPGSFVNLRTPALEICRVYEWQSKHHHLAAKSMEPILLYIYPLGLAISVLEGESATHNWISDMVTNSPVTSGYKPGRFRMLRFSQLTTKEMVTSEPVHY